MHSYGFGVGKYFLLWYRCYSQLSKTADDVSSNVVSYDSTMS